MRATAMKSAPELEVATTDEVADALDALSRADLARLNTIAKLRALHAPGLDWQDLLHEAIDKALNGARRWPRRLPFLVFLREVMRSQASEYRRRALSGPVITEADLPARTDGESAIATAPSAMPDPERQVGARRMLREIIGLFDGDVAALAIVAGLADGLSPAEVQKNAGLSPTQYASAQKRIRRAILRAYPEGLI